MLKVYNQNLEPLAILDNAFDISIERRVNEVWQVSFSLPSDDPKNDECKHFNYIEVIGPSGRNYGKYRIMPSNTSKQGNTIRYEAEHVLACLLDDVIDGYEQFTNWTTTQVLEYLLSLQETERWVLDRCDFTRYFHYAFENENGLLAPILSVPQPFDEPFEFAYDTTVYPWKLSLVRPSDEVKAEIRWGKDMTSFDEVSDPSEIVNYLIPKGYGEGVNQLTIKDVNGGLNYLKDDESIAEWGKKSYIWIDRRFTNMETLKAAGESLLKQWKDPKISFTCGTADLSILPEYAHEQRTLNGVTRIIVEDKTYEARIIGESIADLSKEYEVSYEINNKLDDIATIQTDVERKIRTNDAYSQGTTNFVQDSQSENADANHPVVFKYRIANDVENINTLELTYETTGFRAYSGTTVSGGSTTSAAGGGGTSGPSSRTTSASGGGGTSGPSSRSTAASGGDHSHIMFKAANDIPNNYSAKSFKAKNISGLDFEFDLHAGFADMVTWGASGDHTHDMDHTHTMPSHTHNMDHTHQLPDHTHDNPAHSHGVKHEITVLDTLPDSIEIKVDGNVIPNDALSGENIDLVPYLQKDSSGKISRNRWATIELKPDGLARINATIISRLFINSHIGGTY